MLYLFGFGILGNPVQLARYYLTDLGEVLPPLVLGSQDRLSLETFDLDFEGRIAADFQRFLEGGRERILEAGPKQGQLDGKPRDPKVLVSNQNLA